MHWRLDEVRALSLLDYEVLVEMLNREQQRADD